MRNFLHRYFPGLFPVDYAGPLEPIRSLDDRLDFACMQLVMVQESLGVVTQGHVRTAAFDWAMEGNEEEYTWLRDQLMEMVTA